MLNLKTDHYLKILFFALPIIYLFLFGIWGYELTDTSYMRGWSYRMIQDGEQIYKDFQWRLPPVTLYVTKWLYQLTKWPCNGNASLSIDKTMGSIDKMVFVN